MAARGPMAAREPVGGGPPLAKKLTLLVARKPAGDCPPGPARKRIKNEDQEF